MDTIVQARLDRVETALATLIESITSFNPSIPAAEELLDADSDLTVALDQRTAPSTSQPHQAPSLDADPPNGSAN
jgi:hypothetical protein